MERGHVSYISSREADIELHKGLPTIPEIWTSLPVLWMKYTCSSSKTSLTASSRIWSSLRRMDPRSLKNSLSSTRATWFNTISHDKKWPKTNLKSDLFLLIKQVYSVKKVSKWFVLESEEHAEVYRRVWNHSKRTWLTCRKSCRTLSHGRSCKGRKKKSAWGSDSLLWLW